MIFPYNPRKATQAVAELVRLNGGSIDLWRMLKLVYLFDRESLLQTGAPITGDELNSLPFGPTPSRIYDNTKSHRPHRFKDAIWRDYLTESSENTVRLLNAEFDSDELSQFDREIIEKVWNEFSQMSFSRLWDYVHALPEYRNPNGSSVLIDPEEILKTGHWTQQEITAADNNAKRDNLLAQING
jgi:uncharacterized phage-associated protein